MLHSPSQAGETIYICCEFLIYKIWILEVNGMFRVMLPLASSKKAGFDLFPCDEIKRYVLDLTIQSEYVFLSVKMGLVWCMLSNIFTHNLDGYKMSLRNTSYKSFLYKVTKFT